MGIKDLIWKKSCNDRRKAEERATETYERRSVAEANKVHEEVKESGMDEMTDNGVLVGAEGFFMANVCNKAVPYYDELFKRNYDDGLGVWAEKAAHIYYFGYDGAEKDKAKAGNAIMTFWEQYEDAIVNPIAVLGVIFDTYRKTKNPGDHSELAVLTKDRMDKIMEKSLRNSLKLTEQYYGMMRSEEVSDKWSFNTNLMAAEQYAAYRDLDLLGFWQTVRTAEAVTGLFRSWAEKGDAAAMYWLSVCHFAGISGGKKEDAEKLLRDSAQMGYAPSISEYYRSFRGNLSGEEFATLEAVMEKLQQRSKEFMQNFTPYPDDSTLVRVYTEQGEVDMTDEQENAVCVADIESADCAQLLTEVSQTLLGCYKPDDEAGYGGATVRSWLENLYGTNSFGLADSIKTNHNNWADRLTDKQSLVEKLCTAGMLIAYRNAMNGDIFAVVDLFSAGYVFGNMELTAEFAAKIAKAGNTYALEEMANMHINGYRMFGREIDILRAEGVQGAEAAARYITVTSDAVKEKLLREIRDLSKKDSMHFEYDRGEAARYAKAVTAMLKAADR